MAGDGMNLVRPSRILGGMESYGMFGLSFVLSLTFLAFDLIFPLGVAGGMPHAVAVMLALWFPSRHQVVAITLIGVLAVVLGYFFSPPGSEVWKVYANRGLAIFVITVVGAVIYIDRARTAKPRSAFRKNEGRRADRSWRNDPVSTTGFQGLMAVFFLLLIEIGAAVWVDGKSADARQAVSHTHEVKIGLGSILSTLQDAETGQRGYLLTGDEQYLEPYDQAIASLAEIFGNLRFLTAGDPNQQANLDKIKPLMTSKLDELKETIRLREEEGLDAALAVVTTHAGKVDMDNLREIIGNMVSMEDLRLTERKEHLAFIEMLAVATTLLGFVLVTVVGAILAYRVWSLMLVRNEAEDRVREAKAAAEKANLELQRLTSRLKLSVQERTRELAASDAEREKLYQAVEQSPSMMFITDPNGVIQYANQRFYDVTGYGPEEVIGETPRILKSTETALSVYEELWGTIKSGKIWRGELKERCKDGRYFWANATIAPLKNDDGEIVSFFASHEDITERKEVERKMLKAKEEAVIANRAKSDLLANMSHELRTPLNAIIGFSGSMKAEVFGSIDNAKYREYLEDIHLSGEHLLDLINDILDVSAIEARALELDEEVLDPRSVIDSAIRIIQPRAEKGNVSIRSSVATDVPNISADNRRLKQVFLNLLSNAVKFTPEDGEVSVSGWVEENGTVAFAVSDTGIGMGEEAIKKAVTPFGQVDSGLDRKHEGSGLGLPLTIGLVELHGGTLDINSAPGNGTTITVTLPKQHAA